jgi:GTP-binding protein
MKFIDTIEIRVQSGNGGDGMLCFKRARNLPKLGPDGGNGGNGGDVILEADPQLNTLHALRFRKLYLAENGEKGGTQNCTGRCGESCVIPVPLGTLVLDADTREILGELLEPGQRLLVAEGGKRGYGNLHFVTSTRQAPHLMLPGKKGVTRMLHLELKVLADVGLAGFPNAGKSTLLSQMSAARPQIADYPFTTLTPNLGVIQVRDDEPYGPTYVMADIPGLVEGASEGKGLGFQFLKHLERTRLIVYLLGAMDFIHAPEAALPLLEKELQAYSPELACKEKIVVLNKIDLLSPEEHALQVGVLEKMGYEVISISGATGKGVAALKARLYERLQELV